MRLYIAYASEDLSTAEQVHLALLGDNHQVFFDRGSLQAGDNFDRRFRDAIDATDMMIFLVSSSSLQPGCYALTELDYARRRWPHPQDHLLPVIVRPVELSTVPAYLRAVTILEPRGSIAAEVAQAVRVERVRFAEHFRKGHHITRYPKTSDECAKTSFPAPAPRCRL